MLAVLAVALAYGGPAAADDVTSAARTPRNTVDAQLVLALPAALAPGLSSGVGASYLRGATAGGHLAWGGRASWSTATEYTRTEAVRNDDIRLRLSGVVRHLAGRGWFGARVGVGATVVYENRTRAQGSRAGLTGSDLENSAWYLLPAADLEGVVVLRVWGDWGMSLEGGPTLHLVDGDARFGWTTALGVTWQP